MKLCQIQAWSWFQYNKLFIDQSTCAHLDYFSPKQIGEQPDSAKNTRTCLHNRMNLLVSFSVNFSWVFRLHSIQLVPPAPAASHGSLGWYGLLRKSPVRYLSPLTSSTWLRGQWHSTSSKPLSSVKCILVWGTLWKYARVGIQLGLPHHTYMYLKSYAVSKSRLTNRFAK